MERVGVGKMRRRETLPCKVIEFVWGELPWFLKSKE